MENRNEDFVMLPTNDFCFKELMYNHKIRKGFIAALLGKSPDEIEDTTLLPTETRRRTPDDKYGILDVKVALKDKTLIDMEMQVLYYEHWNKRVLFYLTKMYTYQIKKGDDYSQLQKCIHVSILNFKYFKNDDRCYRTIRFCDSETGEEYSDLLEIKILELPKTPAKISDSDQLIRWMKFFSGRTRKDFENMKNTDEYIEEAVNELFHLSEDEMNRIEYEQGEKALFDYVSYMRSATKQGLEQGLEQGQNLKLKQQIRKKLQKGLSLEAIADQVEEDLETVKALIAEMETEN